MKFSSFTSWYVLISFLNGLIASLLCLNNFTESALFWSIQSALFGFSATYAHFFFLFLFSTFPFWLLGKLSGKTKLFQHLILIGNMLLVMLVYLDTRIYELYKFHLNGMVIELISGGALQDILSFNVLVWALFLSIAIAFIFFELFLGRFLAAFIQNSKTASLLTVLSLITLLSTALISQSIYIWSDAKGDVTITALKRYIPWAQTITAKRRLRKLGVEINESTEQNLSYDVSTLNYPKNPLQCNAQSQHNLLIIVVDSLRDDMLTKEIMPNTWALAQKSYLFSEYYSVANSTRFGVFSLMYGLPGNYWHSMLNAQKGSEFINELDRQQYQFLIHTAAPLYSPEFDRTVFAQTKDYINPAPSRKNSHAKDKAINDAFISDMTALEQNPTDQPFFGFLFYDSPHSYSYPESFKEPFTPSWNKINYLELDNDFDPTEFFNRYKNSAAYTDLLLDELYKNLEQKNLLENTVIIFTSDHGQEFNETKQNFWGHNGNFSRYQTKVPFFIYWPETHPLHGSGIRNEQTASIDVVPTLMKELLNCSNPIKDYSLGLNMFDELSNYDRPLLMESWSKRAIVGKDYIMVSHDAGGKEVLTRDYQPLEELDAPQDDFSTILKQMSAFNK